MRKTAWDAAIRLQEKFYEGFLTLGRMPGIGHYHDELLSRKFRFWNLYPYVVVYAWEAKPIQVVGVIHGGRDLAAILALREGIDRRSVYCEERKIAIFRGPGYEAFALPMVSHG